MSSFRSLLKVVKEFPKRLFHAVTDGAKRVLQTLRIWAQDNPRTSKVIVVALVAALSAALLFGFFAFIGFTPGGIVAAAAWHASIGIVSAGSLFAILQSLAATGMIGAIGAFIGASMSVISIHFGAKSASAGCS
ncbi:hypothetical protein EV426DRAFT_706630 [Tirmania nivea]|nr:hypothetical protein EV426DRAFT_706630 [Tirmania nivea]